MYLFWKMKKFTDYFFKEGGAKKYLSDKYDDILAKEIRFSI